MHLPKRKCLSKLNFVFAGFLIAFMFAWGGCGASAELAREKPNEASSKETAFAKSLGAKTSPRVEKAAEKLGISTQALADALGSPPNIESAAKTLNISKVQLEEALGIKSQSSKPEDSGTSVSASLKAVPGSDIDCAAVLKFTIIGSSGHDILEGTPADDIIYGGAGNDTIHGLGGNDIICGGDGIDKLYGDDGDDSLSGGNGGDTLEGGPGSDWLSGDNDADYLYGESLASKDSPVCLSGSQGCEDWLIGGYGNDLLFGGPGPDYLFGDLKRGALDDPGKSLGNDNMHGGHGDDNFWDLGGSNQMFGQEGDDKMWGGKNNDSLTGGPGDDAMWGSDGDDSLVAGGGFKLGGGSWPAGLGYDQGHDKLYGEEGNDQLMGGQIIDGGLGTNVCKWAKLDVQSPGSPADNLTKDLKYTYPAWDSGPKVSGCND